MQKIEGEKWKLMKLQQARTQSISEAEKTTIDYPEIKLIKPANNRRDQK